MEDDDDRDMGGMGPTYRAIGSMPKKDREQFFRILEANMGENVTDSEKQIRREAVELAIGEAQGRPRRTLGRGLGALLGEMAVAMEAAPPQQAPLPELQKDMRSVGIDLLGPGPFQPRRVFETEALQDLANSIREKGLLQPILVRAHPSVSGKYQIVAGERRWRAAQLAGLHSVPIVLRELSDQQALEVAIIENVQRQDLSAVEEAEGYQRLVTEFMHSHDDVARVVGKSRTYISNTLRLLKLPEAYRAMIDRGEISAGHARALLSAPNPEMLLRRIKSDNLSVRETEAAARGGAAPAVRAPRPSKGFKDPNIMAVERQLAQATGLSVSILANGESGVVQFKYRSIDQLNNLIHKLTE